MDKLYPPSIDGTIPAFYSENTEEGTTAEIVVPFSMNRAVSKYDIKGFCLKIKTIQTNTVIGNLKAEKEEEQFKNNIIKFIVGATSISNETAILNQINPGQFLKVQLAYLFGDGDKIEDWSVGYYSTVGIIKYTNKPTIAVQQLKDKHDNDEYPLLLNYTGEYENSDITEKPYEQKFSLYKINEMNNKELLEESDWFLYDLNLPENNKFNFQTLLLNGNEQINYIIQYDIITINGLKLNISYKLLTLEEAPSQMPVKLIAENNFDDGYIKLFFKEDGWSFTQYATQINENQLEILNSNDQNDIFSEISENILTIINNNSANNIQNIEINENSILLLKNIIFPQTNSNDTIIKIYRSKENDKNWKEIATFKTDNFLNIFKWDLKDFNIEQGETYQYAFKEYKDLINNNQLFYSNSIYADFEDSFLYDGNKQLKIRFNPQISSFKINRLEQKTDTIGSQFPFIFRNNIVNYKEFPISGLISYHMDNNEEFITKEDLGIVSNNAIERSNTPEVKSINNIESVDVTDYNIKAERIFKLKVLDWLGDGKIKLFKSPTEGNYLVRLMNISLSPEKQLSRLLHNFSCTAYEVQEYNYKNLSKFNFFQND